MLIFFISQTPGSTSDDDLVGKSLYDPTCKDFKSFVSEINTHTAGEVSIEHVTIFPVNIFLKELLT